MNVNTKYNNRNMPVPLVIVICILVILGMVVEVNAAVRVHGEYLRRRQDASQSRFNRIHEPPAGVHAEYIRQRIYSQSAVKIPRALPARQHIRQPTPLVRHRLRHQQRTRGNIYL